MRNFVRSIGLFRPLADQGDAWAQTRLGLMYANGQGVPTRPVLRCRGSRPELTECPKFDS
jgi:TPR repeat protein